MKTFNLLHAKMYFEHGLLTGAAIYFHAGQGDDSDFYTVSFQSALEQREGDGVFVDSNGVRKFESLDTAHLFIREVGFRSTRFWISAK